MNPYLITSILFLLLAGLGALDSSLFSFEILPWFNGLRWLSVHLITLGALGEAIFGFLPVVVARHSGRQKPPIRWDIWLAFTAGLLTLMVGVPLMNYILIITGGTLIFVAALLLMRVIAALAPARTSEQRPAGKNFYLAGLGYLLLGVIVGSGLWFGWGSALGIATPVEVHIHANTWGFMSLVFAGLAVDLFQRWTGRPLAWPGSIRPIFWLMTLGALGAVLGPWLAVAPLTAAGILLQQAGTVWLLLNMILPLPGTQVMRRPGIWHIITSYFWQFAIVLSAPLIFVLLPNFSTVGVEQTAPQVLIYAWMLQYGYALLPYLLRRAVSPQQESELGGSWFSLAAAHAGGLFLGASILIPNSSALLLGTAYLLWFLSFIPIARQLWLLLRAWFSDIPDAVDQVRL
jgi:hypothetical protein